MGSIRQATSLDAERLWDIRKKAIQSIPSSAYEKSTTERWGNISLPPIFEKMIDDNFFLVYEIENQIVGGGFLDLKKLSIEGMFVLPEMQGKGVGKAILNSLLLDARQRSFAKLSLASTLNAERFYHSCGFKSLRFSQYTSTTGQELACVDMEIEL